MHTPLPWSLVRRAAAALGLALLALLGPDPALSAREAAPGLPDAALALLDAQRPLEAWELLVGGLVEALEEGAWDQERAVAEAEVAALLLGDTTARLSLWPEVVEALPVAGSWSPGTPARVGFLLDRLLTRAMVRVGRFDRARGITDSLGYITNWAVIGPFDNERGRGMGVSEPVEEHFDRDAVLPGKGRDVSWRDAPAREHPLGLMRLDRMVRPAEQVACYLTTSLRAFDPGPYVLHLGTSGPVKVWVGGELVHEQTVERPHASDQERIVIHLERGWNPVLVKLGHEEGAFTFSARTTLADGTPVLLRNDSDYAAWPGPAPSDTEVMLRVYAEDGTPPPPGFADLMAGGDPGEGDGPAAGEHDGPEGEGGPPPGMPDLQLGDPEDGFEGPAEPVSREDPELAREALQILEALDGDAAAQRWLCLYHLFVHPRDVTERAALAAADAALELVPDDPATLGLVARAAEITGASLTEREVNRRLKALKTLLEVDPDHVWALLQMVAFSLDESPTPRRALELSARAVELAPESWDALNARAEVLAARGRDHEAEQLLARAQASPEADTRMRGLLARARQLTRVGLVEEGHALLEQARRRDGHHRQLLDVLVDGSIDRGDLALAVDVTNRALLADPFDVRRMLRTAARLELGEHPAPHRARELVERALAVCPDHEGALRDLARLDEREGQPLMAAQTLERLLELDPTEDRLRRHLALLTEEDEERFEDPYRWDAAELLEVPMPPPAANDAFEVLSRTVVVKAARDGARSRYEHLALRVLSEAGVRALARMTLGRRGSDLRVDGVRVLRPDGTVIPVSPPRRRGGWTRTYELPPLSVGDLLDLEWRQDTPPSAVFGDYFGMRHEFFPDRLDTFAPTRRSELVLLTPPGLDVHVAEANAERMQRLEAEDPEGGTVRRWLVEDLERPDLEPAMPARSELVPSLDITTYGDWDAFATWWWHFIEKEFVTTEAMRQKVAELTEGLATEGERVAAIVRFVGQEIRYNSWPFGTHGYEPFSAASIFERRFGDCKDKSILLRQMLAEIGVEAHPVLIKAQYRRPDEPLDAAMVEHFNHCIAWLPPTEEREGYYLDATADLNPVEYLRADDQGARVLHVSELGGDLADIPYAPPDGNAMRRRYRVRLDGRGGATVEMLDESNGIYGVEMRQRFGGQQAALEDGLARMLRGGFGQVTIDAVQTSDLEDITEPARLEVDFSTQDLWTSSGNRRQLPLGFEESGLIGVVSELPGERTHDVVLDRPFAQESTLVYELPPGTRIIDLPESVTVEAGGLVDFLQTLEAEGDTITIRRRLAVHVRRIEPGDYAAFREAVQAIDRADRRVVLIEPPAETSR